MSDNAVEYKGRELTEDEKWFVSGMANTAKRSIDYELGLANSPEAIEFNRQGRVKTYTVKYAKDGIMIEGFIDGVLTDSGIVKFNRKDKLDVN